jgi:rare lipoprotein A
MQRPAKATTTAAGQLYLQVGAFTNHDNASQLLNRLVNATQENVLINRQAHDTYNVYRVRIGPLSSEAAALKLSAQLSPLGIDSPHIVVE